MGYSTRLQEREEQTGRPVRVGLAGAGQMGSGFVAQVQRITGLEIWRHRRRRPQPGRQRLQGRSASTRDADGGKRHAVLTDAARARPSADVDMVVDATGVPTSAPAVPGSAARRQARRPAQRRVRRHHRLPARRGSPGITAASTRCAAATNPPRPSGSSSSPATWRSRWSAPARARTTRSTRTATPDSLLEEADQQAHEPEDAVQLRRRLQGDDRDGRAGQRRRTSRSPSAA